MSGSIEEIRSIFEELERYLFDVVNGVQDGKEVRTTAFERTEQLSKQLRYSKAMSCYLGTSC